jgi:hypothetical protein
MYEERIMELNEKYSQNYMDGIKNACGRMIFWKALTQGLIKIILLKIKEDAPQKIRQSFGNILDFNVSK